jgi:hypothetical protein
MGASAPWVDSMMNTQEVWTKELLTTIDYLYTTIETEIQTEF